MADQSRRETALSEAARWRVRLGAEDATEQERLSFQQWLEQSPENARARDDLGSMLNEIDGARDLILETERESRGAGLRSRVFGARGGWWLMAASVVLAITAVWLLRGSGPGEQTYQTGTAERRSVELADGSRVDLNAESRIAVDFSGSARAIRMGEGEALFDVRSDEKRPFVVETGAVRIRVMGTQFNVRTEPGQTVVTGVEGVVGISLSGEADKVRELRAGQQVRCVPGSRLGAVTEVDADSITAWQRGRLIYRGEPLAQVLRDLNRYLPGRTLRAEPELEGLEVSGTFRLEDVDSALRALELALPIRSESRGDVILFVPAPRVDDEN